jgi:hypothetical protein
LSQYRKTKAKTARATREQISSNKYITELISDVVNINLILVRVYSVQSETVMSCDGVQATCSGKLGFRHLETRKVT